MGHIFLSTLDPNCFVSTDTLTRTSDTEFSQHQNSNQDNKFNLHLQSNTSVRLKLDISHSGLSLNNIFSHRTPQGFRHPNSAGSSLENIMPPFPTVNTSLGLVFYLLSLGLEGGIQSWTSLSVDFKADTGDTVHSLLSVISVS